MVFAGVGLVALPLDLVQSFLGRLVAVITKSEYIKRARGLGQRAAAVKARPWRCCMAFAHAVEEMVHLGWVPGPAFPGFALPEVAT